MIHKIILKYKLHWLTLPLALAWMPMALAGGFNISVEAPPASSNAQAKGAVLLVRTFTCQQPADASLSGTAEGLVNGKRQSIPLQFTRTSERGVYAIQQQWPAEGVWLLAITGRQYLMTRSVIVELGPNGKVQAEQINQASTNNGKDLCVRVAQQKPTTAEIETALQSLAAKATQKPQAASLAK